MISIKSIIDQYYFIVSLSRLNEGDRSVDYASCSVNRIRLESGCIEGFKSDKTSLSLKFQNVSSIIVLVPEVKQG